MGDERPHGGKRSLESAIEETGLKAFQPSGDDASRLEGQQEFGALLSR